MKRKNKKSLNADFDAKILKTARQVADAYDIVLRFEDGEWIGHALEYPEAIGTGKTPTACTKAIREVAVSGLAVMLEMGETPPAPARQGIRSEQVNIRVTVEEKAILEATAKQRGFRGLSDFIRSEALTSLR